MIPRPPRSTRTDTLFPYTTLFRSIRNSNLELRQGSIVNGANLDELLQGVESVVCMLGDAKMQSKENVNTAFVKKLIPAMRRQDVKKLLYQAGGATNPYKEKLPLDRKSTRLNSSH